MPTQPNSRDLLNLIENQLRDLVRDVLLNNYGQTWPDQLPIAPKIVNGWRKNVLKEQSGATGRVGDDRLLYQATFKDLSTVITDPTLWPIFEPCFHDSASLETYLDRLRDFRNRLSHGRDLVPFETELVSGMVGQIRQQITIFRSSGAGGPEPQHFARIEEITDSFGNRVTVDADGNGFCDTGLTLRPGDTIRFTCSAIHPRGEPLRWRMWAMHMPDHVSPAGYPQFSWTVELGNEHIHQQCDFRIELGAEKPPRAQGHCDGFVDFRYTVLPSLST